MIRSELDADKLRSREVEVSYPHIKINDFNKCIPLMISCLDDGNIPVLASLNGVTKIIKNMSNSAINFSKLLRVTDVTLYVSNNDSFVIKSIFDYMEVADKWI